MNIAELKKHIADVPDDTKVNVTVLRGEAVEPTDHPVADCSYDHVSEIFDLFVDA